jgi:hypothetical protein
LFAAAGVDVLELRLDFIQDFQPDRDLDKLMRAATLPYIITYRPKWEGGNYDGPEPQRLATLKLAAIKGAPYVDVEWKAAALFFAGVCVVMVGGDGGGDVAAQITYVYNVRPKVVLNHEGACTMLGRLPYAHTLTWSGRQHHSF